LIDRASPRRCEVDTRGDAADAIDARNIFEIDLNYSANRASNPLNVDLSLFTFSVFTP
jgi:hypothetical protein